MISRLLIFTPYLTNTGPPQQKWNLLNLILRSCSAVLIKFVGCFYDFISQLPSPTPLSGEPSPYDEFIHIVDSHRQRLKFVTNSTTEAHPNLNPNLEAELEYRIELETEMMDSHHRNLNDTHPHGPHHDDEDTYDPVRLPPTSHSVALQWLKQTRSTSTHSEPADIYASSYDDDAEHLPSRTNARLTGDVKFDHLHDQHYHENDDRDSISSTMPQYHDHDNTSTSFDSDRAHATLTTPYANTNSRPGTSNANTNHAVSASASETSRTRDGRRRKIRRKRGSHDLRYEYHQENKE